MPNRTLSLISTRFTFLLCVLFVYCFNNGALPFLYYIQQFTTPLLQSFIPWFAAKFLQLPEPITVFTNGSGDTTYDYVVLLCVLITAIFGTVLWSAFDRKRQSHNQLFYWLTVILRFYVGFMLVHYGIAKLNNGQFPTPGISRLTGSYGDSSPMGLAWTFLGYSDGYKWFMFFAEIMGILLLFRKTATIGAFLCLITSANIMAINYFFDVPVKILTTALVIMCLIILSPNIARLFNFFFRGKLVELYEAKAPVFKAKWMWITAIVCKYAAVILYIAIPLVMALNTALTSPKQDNTKSELFGAYDIVSLKWVKESPDPDSTFSSAKWKLMAFDSYDYGFTRFGENEKDWYTYKIDQKKKTVDISFVEEPKVTYKLNYQFNKDKQLVLNGLLFGQPVNIELEKKKFELLDRGFRWVNERPYNR